MPDLEALLTAMAFGFALGGLVFILVGWWLGRAERGAPR